MGILPYVAATWILLAGLYGIVTSRHLFHLILCLAVVQSSTYLFLLAVGFRRHVGPPVFTGSKHGGSAVDPVVQAMTLTDIVVGATVTALLLALAIRAHRRFGTLDPEELRIMEG